MSSTVDRPDVVVTIVDTTDASSGGIVEDGARSAAHGAAATSHADASSPTPAASSPAIELVPIDGASISVQAVRVVLPPVDAGAEVDRDACHSSPDATGSVTLHLASSMQPEDERQADAQHEAEADADADHDDQEAHAFVDTVVVQPRAPYHTPFPYAHRPSVSRSGINSTLRRIPSQAHRSFAGIPDGVITMVLEHLTSRECCVVSRANRRILHLATRNSLWAVRMGFLQHPDVHASSALQASMKVETRLKSRYLRYRQWKLSKIEADYASRVKSLRQRKVMCALHWLDGPCFFLIIGVCMVLGFALTARHIDSTQASGPLDAVAVFPYFLALAFAVGVTLALCLARLDRHSQRCFHADTYSDPNGDGFVRVIMVSLLQDNTPQLWLTGGMFLLFVLWAVLFLARVCAWITISYTRVFAPLFAVFVLLALMCFHPLARGMRWKQRLTNCGIAWCCAIGPIFAFMWLVYERMQRGIVLTGGDAQSLSWMYVMIPLFFLNFLVACISIGVSVDERSSKAALSALCCYGPLLCFEVLLAHWLDTGGFAGDTPRFAHVLVPLWIFMALCLLLSLVICAFNRPQTTRLSILAEPYPVREPLLL